MAIVGWDRPVSPDSVIKRFCWHTNLDRLCRTGTCCRCHPVDDRSLDRWEPRTIWGSIGQHPKTTSIEQFGLGGQSADPISNQSAPSSAMGVAVLPFPLAASRVVVVSIYLWSAIGKFDFQFLNGLGRQFAAAITDMIGLSVAAENISPWAVSLMPAGELLVGVLLIFSTTRKLGVVAAIGLHLGLVAILGPWGMDHHLGVVIWNPVFALISAIAFWPPRKQADFQAEPFSLSRISTKYTLTIVFTAIVVGLPLYSTWDHWLAWGLYSPNNRRCTLKLMVTPDQDIDETLQPFLVPVETEFIGGLDVLKFDMGRMSLEMLDAPIYPEARMQLGVAHWVKQRFKLPASTIVSIEGKSDRFTGARDTTTIESTQSGDQQLPFLFNHLPR